eukprot:scaffold140128_cov68-Cyclotella_meneghiniana.AAC.1
MLLHTAASALSHSFSFLLPHYVITDGDPTPSTHKKRSSSNVQSSQPKQSTSKKGCPPSRSSPIKRPHVNYNLSRRCPHPTELEIQFARQQGHVSQSQETALSDRYVHTVTAVCESSCSVSANCPFKSTDRPSCADYAAWKRSLSATIA